MGVCGSTANKAYKEQQQQQQQPSDEKVSSSLEDAAKDRSRAIDAQLKKDANSRTYKLLLLGAGESGKTDETTWSDADRLDYRDVIRISTLQSMQAVLTAMFESRRSIAAPEGNAAAREVIRAKVPESHHQDLSDPIYEAMQLLYQQPEVLDTIKRRAEYQLNDSAEYFFDSLKRMRNPDYMPSESDILRARVKTVGISETRFSIEGQAFIGLDPGGQRSERKKWIHCFDNVDCLLFVIGLSEYDQVLREASDTSRMKEAEDLFESTINSKWFTKAAIVVFGNKMDLLEKKLKMRRSRLTDFYPDMDPSANTSVTVASKSLMTRFLNLNRDPSKTPFVHYTTALDTRQMETIIKALAMKTLREHLAQAGFL